MVGPGNSSCASMCQCTNAVYEPVCGNNSVMYFSACSAGCQNRVEKDNVVSFAVKHSSRHVSLTISLSPSLPPSLPPSPLSLSLSLSQTVVFANCSCVAETLSNMTYSDQPSQLFLDILAQLSTSESQPCDNGCNTLAPFLAILPFALFLIFMVQIPITFMSMR